jgi:hypothetical protein
MALSDTIANLMALGFDNPSIGGIYKQVATVIQAVVDTIAAEIADNVTLFTNLITQKTYGKGGYYVIQAKAFQFGDNLLINTTDGTFYYQTIDTTKQIITQASYFWDKTINYQSLKVATQDTGGNTIALQPNQLAAFVSYMNNFILAGIPLQILSLPPNVIIYTATLTYYSTYDLSTLQTNFAAAQKAFQNNFTFNGVFYQNDFTDYIKANVPGVRDFFLNTTTIDGVPFVGETTLQSGVFSISNTSSITYVSI